MSPMLVDRLREKYKESGLSMTAWAADIGMTQRMCHFVLTGKRQPGGQTLSLILRRFPDLKDEVWEYIDSKAPSKGQEGQ